MVQIVPAAQRRPSFSERLNVGVGRGIEGASKLYEQHQQKEQEQMQRQAIEKLMGEGSGNLPSKLQELMLQNRFKQEEMGLKSQQEDQKVRQKENEKAIPLQIGLGSVDQMRNIRKKGNLGRGSSAFGFFGGETAKDRGEYETLGNSLISYASNIPIRNRLEFEKLAGRISDPSTTDKEAEGILDALESIIQGSLSQYENPENEEERPSELKELNDEAMKMIYEKSGGNKEKAMKIAKKMGYRI